MSAKVAERATYLRDVIKRYQTFLFLFTTERTSCSFLELTWSSHLTQALFKSVECTSFLAKKWIQCFTGIEGTETAAGLRPFTFKRFTSFTISFNNDLCTLLQQFHIPCC